MPNTATFPTLAERLSLSLVVNAIRDPARTAVAQAEPVVEQILYFDQSGSPVRVEDGCDYYLLRYRIAANYIYMVYGEEYSNFNGTSNPNPYTYTSKYTKSYTEHFEGSAGVNLDIFSFSFSFQYEQTVTAEMDISVTATASPNQWLTGLYGSWFEVREAAMLHHTCDGQETVISSPDFMIWTPTGATGWFFNNDAP